MGDTHFVHVLHAPHELLKETIGLGHFELSCSQHKSVQVPACTVLHDLAIIAFCILICTSLVSQHTYIPFETSSCVFSLLSS